VRRPSGFCHDAAVTLAEHDGDFAVVAYREEGAWQAGALPVSLVDDLDGLLAALRQQPSEGPVLGLVGVGDDCALAVRLTGTKVGLLLFDVGAAEEWPIAVQALQALDLPLPEDEDLEMDLPLPAGDLSLFADLGLDEMELGVILADGEAYPDDMIGAIARRLGFGEAFARALELATD
jgi:putative tRNA adenosine deaminase-associated protein